ncbi:MAG: penicillin-binding protein 2 [Bacteroidales bacterium]|nr:penicillin-binding protein 2 [Bacteroidales bacterium]
MMDRDNDNMRQLPQQTTKKKRDRIGMVLYVFYVLLLVITVMVLVKLVYFQLIWKPEPKIAGALTPSIVKRTVEPVRGNIIDCEGRLLAMSYPVYDIHMDCTVMKAEFAKMKNKEKGRLKEEEWQNKARQLSEGLAGLVDGVDAARMYKQIKDGRASGRKYLSIAKGVDRSTMLKIKELPLYREGANRGGMIVESRNIRKYPYGRLARRTIGFVRDNQGLSEEEIKGNPGLEGRYDAILHGKDGREYLKQTDRGRVRNYDSSYVRAVDGKDLRTTLNIDYQDVADRALRERIDSLEDLNGACLVLMEVNTGAIRAMVNLSRDPHRGNSFEEISNFAIGRRCEPGSVFKTVTLLSVMSDGIYKSLDETIPTNHGVVKDTKMKQDIHILDWERENKTHEISILDGFKISSNYVFGTLAVQNYAKNPRQYVEKVYSYGLGDSFDFDLEGLLTPLIPDPKSKYWSNTTLGTMGFGYATEETPLHILTFYNAIANKGKMVKPYLVECIEKAGTVTDRRGPSVLNASICSKAIADTMTRALLSVTEEGTARRLKSAKCKVAGKTGTSFATFPNGKYVDENGRRQYQGTFVGYFPAEDPQYSVICAVYSRPTRTSYQGGGIPAAAIKTLVDYVYTNDPRFRTKLPKK